MSNHVSSVIANDKQVLRTLIAGQVEEFLKRGGEVEVVERRESHLHQARASVWDTRFEIPEVIDN